MRRTAFTACLCVLLASPLAAGIWGIPDVVPSATLIVPLIETGVNATTTPHDTLVTVYCTTASKTVHWEIYNIDGESSDGLFGNFTINDGESKSFALRDLIATASTTDKTRLTDGGFYRGFMTFDVVASSTSLTQFDDGYPWGTSNVLLGYIYYTRLSEGSANGIPMVHIEYTATDAPWQLESFYNRSDPNRGYREEIDDTARAGAAALTHGDPMPSTDLDIDKIRSRVFKNAALNGATRLVVFAWTTHLDNWNKGGPSQFCDSMACASEYVYDRYDEAGNLVTHNTEVRLDHVVNLFTVGGADESGEHLWRDIPNVLGYTQIYAFSLNSAKPSAANLNWDAIFSSNIQP